MASTTLALPSVAAGGGTADPLVQPLTIAVIGDVPYGVAQEESWGALIDAVNDHPEVRVVAHVGDVKSGGTACTDERFTAVRTAFDAFTDPVVYTPGDNDWTDCHSTENGRYNPLERLDALRRVFFPEPGSVLGGDPMGVEYQPTLVENVRWIQAQVAFATLHVVGSNNGLSPWSGLDFPAPTAEQVAEVDGRVAATLDWVDFTFDRAEEADLRGVVLVLHATQGDIVNRIAARTAGFDGQVLLLQGDMHVFKMDHPRGLPNLTRIAVHGATLPFEYLRLVVDPQEPELFTWRRLRVRPPTPLSPTSSNLTSWAAGDQAPG